MIVCHIFLALSSMSSISRYGSRLDIYYFLLYHSQIFWLHTISGNQINLKPEIALYKRSQINKLNADRFTKINDHIYITIV